MRYFQNTRNRHDSSIQIVISHKKKTSSSPAVGKPPVALFGVKHYQPPRPSGETDETIAAMAKLMVDEHRKMRPNGERIAELMDATFADRRNTIIHAKSIAEIEENYPALFSADQVTCSKNSNLGIMQAKFCRCFLSSLYLSSCPVSFAIQYTTWKTRFRVG